MLVGFLLALNLSIAAGGVSATSTVPGDSLLSSNVWDGVWQSHFNTGVPQYNAVCIGLLGNTLAYLSQL